MINFIVCDDNEYVRDINAKIIKKITMPYDFDYNIYSFEKYNLNMKNIIKTPADTKIYILDLELPGKTGMDIAKEIRKEDWDSIIIILTSHDELELKLLKQKLLILDFISKFDNIEKSLTKTINMVIKNLDSKKVLTFKSNKEIHHVKLDNILYLYRDNNTLQTIVVTNDGEYNIRDSLVSISKKLDQRFYQTHRACFINIDKVKKVDFIKGIIYFENNKNIDYLSRNYKKGLKDRL